MSCCVILVMKVSIGLVFFYLDVFWFWYFGGRIGIVFWDGCVVGVFVLFGVNNLFYVGIFGEEEDWFGIVCSFLECINYVKVV